MLLEAAMSELQEDIAMSEELQEDTSSTRTPPDKEGQVYLNGEEGRNQANFHNAAIFHHPGYANAHVSLSPDDHSPAHYALDYKSSSNAGRPGRISLLHDDNEFASRILNREPSNLGESNRFGSYRSTAAVAAGGVPFQWEAQPGKSKSSPTIQEEEEDALSPLSLPPIRLSSTHNMPPPITSPSPSTSAAPSPRSLTGKMKSLIINHVKKSPMDHFSFTSILEAQRSPSKRSPCRSIKRERKASSVSASEYGSLQSHSVTTSPYNYSAPLKMGNTEEVPRASLNSCSDPCSSPYYFSPLSNTSSLMSHGIMSPRVSIAQSSSGSINMSAHAYHADSHTPSRRGSDSSVSSISSAPPSNAPFNGPAMLANCLLAITSMSDDRLGPTESENADQNGSNSLSFASPEMEVINDELLTSAHSMDNMQYIKPESTMEDFINRGDPPMNRSYSTSRVAFADDLSRKPVPNPRYYSGQLINSAQARSIQPSSSMQDHIHFTAKLDVLFPLKRASTIKSASKSVSQLEESPDDGQAYADALDTSLDSSAIADSGELNSMVQSVMNDEIMEEKPAHEVIIEVNDENGFAYSPVASAFVFSPKQSSQNAATAGATTHYVFKPSTRANISNGSMIHRYNYGVNTYNYSDYSGQPKSILKKADSLELMRRAASFNVKRAGRIDLRAPAHSDVYASQQGGFSYSGPLNSVDLSVHPPTLHVPAQKKSLMPSGSQKISSVLLRFVEAEEQLYHSNKRHHGGGLRSPSACMQPMCSFLGRALLCRPKLTNHHARSLQT